MAGKIEKLTELYNDLWQLDRHSKKYHDTWYEIVDLENNLEPFQLVLFHCRQSESYFSHSFNLSQYHSLKAQKAFHQVEECSADLEEILFKNIVNLKTMETKMRKKNSERRKILFQAARHAEIYLN